MTEVKHSLLALRDSCADLLCMGGGRVEWENNSLVSWQIPVLLSAPIQGC